MYPYPGIEGRKRNFLFWKRKNTIDISLCKLNTVSCLNFYFTHNTYTCTVLYCIIENFAFREGEQVEATVQKLLLHPVLHLPSHFCPGSRLYCIPHVLHPSCIASLLHVHCIPPVLHPPVLNPSCPATLMSFIPAILLYPSCPTSPFPASLPSCSPPVLQYSCYIPPVSSLLYCIQQPVFPTYLLS